MTNSQQDRTITFCLDGEILLTISKEGFYYKGERVDDIHNVYQRFNDWLTKANNK
jgi:hypothetical protein